jgi:hypothetical protein
MHKNASASLTSDRLVHGLCSYLPDRSHLTNLHLAADPSFILHSYPDNWGGESFYVTLLFTPDVSN